MVVKQLFFFVCYAGKCFATLDSPDSWAASQRIEVHAVQEKNKRQKGSVCVVFRA